MDFIKRNKILSTAVIALMVANIFLLTFIWLEKDGQRPGKPLKGGGQFIEEQLKLNSIQREQVESLRDSHFTLMDKLRAKSMKKRSDLHDLIKQGDSQEHADKIASQIGDTQREIEYANYEHFYTMRKLLTEKQQLIFDKTILNVLRGEKGPDGPKGDRPPPREGPDGRRPPPQKGG